MTRSDYNEKQETKKERLLERAEQAEAKSSAAYAEAGRIGEAIPFGQPILVGHHSERQHRADIERIDQNMRKSVEEGAKAKDLRRRAEAVGTAGVSSDDPDAVLKLQARALELEAKQAARKLVNAAWRRAGKPSPENRDAWQTVGADAGLSEEELGAIRLDFAKRIHFEQELFPSYVFRNGNAEIRRLKARIDQLKQAEGAERIERDFGVFELIEDPEENRLRLIFPGKPAPDVRSLLKANGFRWSPTASAWQRQLNDSARLAAKSVLAKFSPGAPDAALDERSKDQSGPEGEGDG